MLQMFNSFFCCRFSSYPADVRHTQQIFTISCRCLTFAANVNYMLQVFAICRRCLLYAADVNYMLQMCVIWCRCLLVASDDYHMLTMLYHMQHMSITSCRCLLYAAGGWLPYGSVVHNMLLVFTICCRYLPCIYCIFRTCFLYFIWVVEHLFECYQKAAVVNRNGSEQLAFINQKRNSLEMLSFFLIFIFYFVWTLEAAWSSM